MSDQPLAKEFITDLGKFSLFRDKDYLNAYITKIDGTPIWEKKNGTDTILDDLSYDTNLREQVDNDFLASVGLDSLLETKVNYFAPPDGSTGSQETGKEEASVSDLREDYKTGKVDHIIQKLSLRNLIYPIDADFGNTQDYIQINQFTWLGILKSVPNGSKIIFWTLNQT